MHIMQIVLRVFFLVWALFCCVLFSWIFCAVVFDTFVYPLLKVFGLIRPGHQSRAAIRNRQLKHIVKTLRTEKPETKMRFYDRKTVYIIGRNGRTLCGRYSLKNKLKPKHKSFDRDFFKKGQKND